MAALLAGLPRVGRRASRSTGSARRASRPSSAACHAIAAGDGDLFVAGGVESMSRAPLVMAKPERAFPRGNQTVWDTTLGWRFPNPRMEALFPLESMGETGENVAERWGVTPRGPGRVRARVAAPLGGCAGGRPLRGRARPGRRPDARRASAARHRRGEARARSGRRSGRTARSRPATRAGSTTAPPRS